MRPAFMFATGIENSYPTIDHGKTRVDQMALCRHYERWRDDFDLVEDVGLAFLRYGPPIHTTWRGEGRYDWSLPRGSPGCSSIRPSTRCSSARSSRPLTAGGTSRRAATRPL